MKLAALAAGGVVVMHAVHQHLGKRVAARALAAEQASLGRTIADLLVEDVAGPLASGDRAALEGVLARATARGGGAIAYCLVARRGEVVASATAPSLAAVGPGRLASLRQAGDAEPRVVEADGVPVLDVARGVAPGDAQLRVGFTMDGLRAARRELARELGLVALAMMVLGVAGAFLVAHRASRALDRILAAASDFDPARGHDPLALAATGSDEIAVLAGRLDRMMSRLEVGHAERERARQTQRLLAVGSLTAGVAHEINNPLAGLLNCVRRLEKGGLPEERRREYLAHMRAGLERIARVVQRLLDFGRPRPVALAPVPLADLAADALALAAPALSARHVACAVEEEEGAGGEVSADRHEIGHALLNLLLNAAYVTPGGGRVVLRLRRRGALGGVAVEDRGPGIPEALRERVLDPFFTTKPEGEGTGLGLPVVRAIVDAHGGQLTFEFPEGKGTVATVWLRAADVNLPRASTTAAARPTLSANGISPVRPERSEA
jgi:two-component system, NtrC family, sensor kinase